MCDMIKPSFIPPEDIRQLRDLMRYRAKLTNMITGEKNRASNCLTVSNLKLDDVSSDVFGKCRIDCFVIIRFAAGPSIARPAASTGRKDEKNGSLPSISDVPDMVFIPEPSLQFRLQYHQKHSYSKDLVCLPVQEYVYDLPSHGKGG